MKKHLSSIVFGCLGLCAGFALCYMYVVIPARDANFIPSVVNQSINSAPATVTVKADRSIHLGNEHADHARLRSFFAERAANGTPVVIRSAKSTDDPSVAALLDVARSAGKRLDLAFVQTTIK